MARKSSVSEEQKAAAELSIAELERTVKFQVTDYTIEFLAGKVEADEYYVPDYQRELTWKDRPQSRFIESLLMGLPIPFLFLWQANDGRLEIVDGSQRLRTIVRFLNDQLKLSNLELLSTLNGFVFSDLDKSRRRKLTNQTIRGIVLDNSVSESTRTEMFNRINTGGTKLNDAEVRRGALPGPFTELVIKLAKSAEFAALTPVSEKAVSEREREELVVRFFTYLERIQVNNGGLDIPGWKDRPREFIWDFVKEANQRAQNEPAYLNYLEGQFVGMLKFVAAAFPYGFRKASTAKQVPRVRFEAISIGSALAIQAKPSIADQPIDHVDWWDADTFADVTTSDAANVKSKLIGRIAYVFGRLAA